MRNAESLSSGADLEESHSLFACALSVPTARLSFKSQVKDHRLPAPHQTPYPHSIIFFCFFFWNLHVDWGRQVWVVVGGMEVYKWAF